MLLWLLIVYWKSSIFSRMFAVIQQTTPCLRKTSLPIQCDGKYFSNFCSFHKISNVKFSLMCQAWASAPQESCKRLLFLWGLDSKDHTSRVRLFSLKGPVCKILAASNGKSWLLSRSISRLSYTSCDFRAEPWISRQICVLSCETATVYKCKCETRHVLPVSPCAWRSLQISTFKISLKAVGHVCFAVIHTSGGTQLPQSLSAAVCLCFQGGRWLTSALV